MAEFGEQLKRARELEGYTQQSFAEKIYVTRQTVSRWESGARYPDLHTTKKIAEVLNVSIDELLSGEELRANIEKIPVLEKNLEVILQTIIYSIACLSYLLMSFFSWKEVIFPNDALRNTPAGNVSVITIIKLSEYTITAILLLIGIIYSSKREITPTKIAFIVSSPYIFHAIDVLSSYIEIQIKHNGYFPVLDFCLELLIPIVCVIGIWFFFVRKSTILTYLIICGICSASLGYVLYGYLLHLRIATDLGFVISTIHALGMIGIFIFLWYQAYIYNKRKKLAIRD